MIGIGLLAFQSKIKLHLCQDQVPIIHVHSKLRQKETILDQFSRVEVQGHQRIYLKIMKGFKKYKQNIYHTLMTSMNICNRKCVRGKSQLLVFSLPKSLDS